MMEFSQTEHLEKRKKSDLLVLPFWNDHQKAFKSHSHKANLPKIVEDILSLEDFKGKEGEVLFLYVEGQPEQRICLLGLGSQEKMTTESLRKSYGTLAKACLSKQLKHLNIIVPEIKKLKEEELVQAIAEGLLLPNYHFNRYKHRDPEDKEETLIQTINWIAQHPNVVEIAEKVKIICEAINIARDLVNDNADSITPPYLAEYAKEIGKKESEIKTTVLDKKRIEKEKMGLLLAVNRGSDIEPAFIMMEYLGNPESSDKTVIIGKGVTYDTGGLNLKPTGGMETMKTDMAGGAACFGIILAVSRLKMKVNIAVVIPTTENGIDAKSFKPGDVYTSYSGKTVEMTNSDAEGRLILADALAYAAKNLNPSRIIDLATLTGAIDIALGPEAAGMMTTNDVLADGLTAAGNISFERLWRMPLFDEYKERLKSDIADLKSWNGRTAGANVAATFLGQFVPSEIPWAHIDIASTAYMTEARKYLPKYATGYGVRLIVEFLRHYEAVKK